MQIRREWTVLFYNAGHADASKIGTGSLVDVETAGSDDRTAVVAFNHRSAWRPEKMLGLYEEFEGARTYEVGKAAPKPQPAWSRLLPQDARHLLGFALASPRQIRSKVIERHPEGTNPGEAETLKKFVVDSMRRYPAKRYALVITGHGAAFGGQAIVHSPEGRLKNEDLARALDEAARQTGRKLDLLNLNTCYSANLETLYPLRNSAEALVASEGMLFAATQPFATVLKDLQQARGEVDARALARLFVEESRRQPLGNLYTPTLSALEAGRLEAVTAAQQHLQETLTEERVPPQEIREALQASRRLLYSSVPREVHLTDAASFAAEMGRRTTNPRVREAAEALGQRLAECVIAEQHQDPARETLTSKAVRFVLRHDERDLSGLGGLTVYLEDEPDRVNSRVDQVEKTEFGQRVDVRGFADYVGRAAADERAARPAWRRLLDAAAEKHHEAVQALGKKVGSPGLVSLAERLALGGLMLGGFSALAAAGVPAYPLIFGTLFAARGLAAVVGGTRQAVGQGGLQGTAARERLVEQGSRAALGAAMGTFGLYLLGALPRAVAWPAAFVAVGVRAAREIGTLWARRHDRAERLEQDRLFRQDPLQASFKSAP